MIPSIRLQPLCGALLAVLLLAPAPSHAFGRHAHSAHFADQPNPQPDGALRSQIDFFADGTFRIRYAMIKTADPLDTCPIDNLPTDLRTSIDELVGKVKDSVNHVHDAQSSVDCAGLTDQLASSHKDFQTALSNEIVSGVAIASDANQERINDATLKASAINNLLATTGQIVSGGCIKNANDRASIQRAVSQVITLGGLLIGQWPGIITAAGGQLIGTLPIFRDRIDEALKAFKEYEEITSRTAFLCLYRQMQKTTTMLFVKPDEHVIHGIDLNFESGPSFTTRQSIAAYQASDPELYVDSAFLNFASTRGPKVKTLGDLIDYCRTEDAAAPALRNPALHPDAVRAGASALRKSCDELNRFAYPAHDHDDAYLTAAGADFQVLEQYYAYTLSEKQTRLGAIEATIKSDRYFEGLRKTVDVLHDPASGNQLRLSYRGLTEELGRTLARETFRDLIKADGATLRSEALRYDATIGYGNPVRGRALMAMLDLCQTLDPTLACLYAGAPNQDPLLKAWAKGCVGRKSDLCQQAAKAGGRALLAGAPKYLAYFDSLCPADEPSTDR